MMVLRTFVLATQVFFLMWVSSGLVASQWYVAPPPLGNDSSPGTEGQPFATIQKGIDTAGASDTVIVLQGPYVENIDFNGKNIVLRSTDPTDRSVVEQTVIDGSKAGSVVTFAGTEDETCVLKGFTVRNGRGVNGGGICGGAEEQRSQARIEANIITANVATGHGGGVAYCNGVVQNNTIFGNSTAGNGGGLGYCDGVIQNNLIVGSADSWHGGGLAFCNGSIRNNTIYGNSASYGGGLYGCGGTISNCIIWGNTGQVGDSPNVTYCCVQGGWAGDGNTGEPPRFVDPDGPDDDPNTYEDNDYRLWVGSSCVDAGKNEDWMADAVDLDGNPRILQGRDSLTVDMGAYEYIFSGPTEETWYVDGAVSQSGDGTSPETAFGTIQEAINRTSDAGDTVIVTQGIYQENIDFNGKEIVLRSTDPTDRSVVEQTVIDGSKAGSVVTFAGTEDETCVLKGFTVRNGRGVNGGGICGGAEEQRSQARIEANIITANVATGHGGGVAYCNGVVQNNTIFGNSTAGNGGGLGYCDGVIQNNLIVGSADSWHGGGLAFCNGSIRNNTIYGNSASYGGGLYGCGGTISNCIIWGNTGQVGDSPNVTYCCVQGGWAGDGNTGESPRFVDPDGPDDDPSTYEDNDYRLPAESPCVDKGKTDEWMWKAYDIKGNPRILPGPVAWEVDMGAYEYMPATLTAAAIRKEESGELRIIRITQPGERYTLQSCLDLLVKSWNEEAIVPSEGSLTTWVDPDTAPKWKFYRIEIQ